jgi:hypothetical protein
MYFILYFCFLLETLDGVPVMEHLLGSDVGISLVQLCGVTGRS